MAITETDKRGPGTNTTVRLDDAAVGRIRAICERTNRKQSEVLRQLLDEGLAAEDGRGPQSQDPGGNGRLETVVARLEAVLVRLEALADAGGLGVAPTDSRSEVHAIASTVHAPPPRVVYEGPPELEPIRDRIKALGAAIPRVTAKRIRDNMSLAEAFWAKRSDPRVEQAVNKALAELTQDVEEVERRLAEIEGPGAPASEA